MKFGASVLAVVLGGLDGAGAVKLQSLRQAEGNPMAKVAQLLAGMKSRIEGDGMAEQQSYDKYACWCEDTLARKARDIANAKVLIDDLQAEILKLKGDTGAGGAEIKNLEKDIAENLAAQEAAKSVRDSEAEEYSKKRTEGEQCAGALEAAVKALSGAGGGKFLQSSMKEARLLSVVDGVRKVLDEPAAMRQLSDDDVAAVRRFVQAPEGFAGGVVALQVGRNPFGDYAPQSSQIQGILKSMYDTFVTDMEKGNAEEAEAQKAFEELMATKATELQTLQATLETTKGDDASKTNSLAENEELQDATKQQLDADEKFFDETKTGCKAKANEWNERSRLRTMEILGVGKAIEILTDPEAMKTFSASATTLVQLAAVSRRALTRRGSGVVKRLTSLAKRYHSFSMLQVAAALRSGGHFDKVIGTIDTMIEELRREEQEDIEHKDRCENADTQNKNNMEDLSVAIEKAGQEIKRLASKEERLGDDVEVIEAAIAKTLTEMQEAQTMRNHDVQLFKQSLVDDDQAIKLVTKATAAIKEFYEKNGIPLTLVALAKSQAQAKDQDEDEETPADEPEYTVDPNKAPETSWSEGAYGGRKDETTGVVGMLDMIKEDLVKEMKVARADDAEAQKLYEEQRAVMQDALDAALGSKVAAEKELAETKAERAATQELQDQKAADLEAEKKLKASIFSDCSWVGTHFESRRTKRKAEVAGLEEAKSYLAGVESGDDV